MVFSIIFRNLYYKKSRRNPQKRRRTCRAKLTCYEGFQFMMQTGIALKRHFPRFLEMLDEVPDGRKGPEYKTHELLMAVIAMFLFRRGSRNNMDNAANKGNFSDNYEKLFGCRLPDMDTSDRLLKELPTESLEALKREMAQVLIRRKVFDKFRYGGLYHSVAVDGSGLYSFNYEPYPGCPKKTSKNGKVTYTVHVLEAKIVCPNSFCISIATEWIRNPENGDYEKQDCELKAFVRLARKIRASYPRLPIMILADGLYPNKTAFDICKANKWPYIFTFKDGNLKTVWEEIGLLEKIGGSTQFPWQGKVGDYFECHIYKYINKIDYNGHSLNFVEARIEKRKLTDIKRENIENERFVHITDIHINEDNYNETSQRGRLRWKIENEGFNSQKNEGYGLSHKFSRKSHATSCNYYQCLQIAHAINQLAYLTKHVKTTFYKDGKETLKALIEFAISLLFGHEYDTGNIHSVLSSNCQLRY